ncbi:electron carrier/ protein disulfide oxidoreductase [Anaeramoeba flamelloides]|uniref:Electron carrier/ protein disulfide oxidoreductase n=1 Tax=Anaeramoeba flamelloides TaxID=1746091 RepID=A0AAV8AC15_9EUKA|nr:electron carrier/ protein disulfide oxidoreductase [Anaeramoeba flamelloides]
MFDEAQSVVFDHMHLNSFDNFKGGELYRDLLRKLNQDSSVGLNYHQKRCFLGYRKRNRNYLNEQKLYLGCTKNANKLLEELMESLMNLFYAYYSISTKKINFKSISKSIAYQKFVEKTSQLKRIDLKGLKTQNERVCFFLNLYNTLALHSLIEHGIPRDKPSIDKFIKSSRYRINEYNFSLNDIFHGILRGNRDIKNPSNNYFKSGDNRSMFSVTKLDTRIHFAIINQYFPSFLQIYKPHNFNDLIGKTTKMVISPLINIQKRKILLPKLFAIYQLDFGGTENIINWLESNLKGLFLLDSKIDYSVKFIQMPLIINPKISFILQNILKNTFCTKKKFNNNIKD